ncbi:hypothetical protein Lal_00021388 [Lupinus albus]|nr:hypothetical protein Lal_00021388 [Lupinus albus]
MSFKEKKRARELSLRRGISFSSEDPLAQARILQPRHVQNITFLAEVSQLSLRRESFHIAQDFTLPVEPFSPKRANSRSGETTLAQASQSSLRRESSCIAQDFTLSGGLGLRSLKMMNKSALLKLAWDMRSSNQD